MFFKNLNPLNFMKQDPKGKRRMGMCTGDKSRRFAADELNQPIFNDNGSESEIFDRMPEDTHGDEFDLQKNNASVSARSQEYYHQNGMMQKMKSESDHSKNSVGGSVSLPQQNPHEYVSREMAALHQKKMMNLQHSDSQNSARRQQMHQAHQQRLQQQQFMMPQDPAMMQRSYTQMYMNEHENYPQNVVVSAGQNMRMMPQVLPPGTSQARPMEQPLPILKIDTPTTDPYSQIQVRQDPVSPQPTQTGPKVTYELNPIHVNDPQKFMELPYDLQAAVIKNMGQYQTVIPPNVLNEAKFNPHVNALLTNENPQSMDLMNAMAMQRDNPILGDMQQQLQEKQIEEAVKRYQRQNPGVPIQLPPQYQHIQHRLQQPQHHQQQAQLQQQQQQQQQQQKLLQQQMLQKQQQEQHEMLQQQKMLQKQQQEQHEIFQKQQMIQKQQQEQQEILQQQQQQMLQHQQSGLSQQHYQDVPQYQQSQFLQQQPQQQQSNMPLSPHQSGQFQQFYQQNQSPQQAMQPRQEVVPKAQMVPQYERLVTAHLPEDTYDDSGNGENINDSFNITRQILRVFTVSTKLQRVGNDGSEQDGTVENILKRHIILYQLLDEPELLEIEAFLNVEECVHVLDYCHQIGDMFQERKNESTTILKLPENDHYVRTLRARAARCLVEDPECISNPCVYKFDATPNLTITSANMFTTSEAEGQVARTLLVYLNGDVDGGEIEMPNLGIAILPKQGYALSWRSINADGQYDYKTSYQNLPVTKGTLYCLIFYAIFK